ncbi:hypothetical protein [Moorena producens]|nr:hypothetical protein [Moorena producens]
MISNKGSIAFFYPNEVHIVFYFFPLLTLLLPAPCSLLPAPCFLFPVP